MKLTDVAPLEKWMELEDMIYERSGMNASVFNTDGIRIAAGKQTMKFPNRLCPEVKSTDKGQSAICAVAHMNLANISKETNAPVIEECDAGLVKILVPIFVKDEFLGTVGACGKRLDDGEVDTYLVSKITEMGEEKVQSLSTGIDSVSTEEATDFTDFIKEKVDQITSEYEKTS